MKTITRILTALTLACLVATATAWAQNADALHKEFKKYRDDKNAKPDYAFYETMSKAGVNFLASFPKDKRAGGVINEMLSYSTGPLGKDKIQQTMWLGAVQVEMTGKTGLADDAKLALAALTAAISEGEMYCAPSTQVLGEWRSKLDTLSRLSADGSFVLDREKAFYNFLVQTGPSGIKVIEPVLAAFSTHTNKSIADWAKQQAKLLEFRKTPFVLSFTDIHGKAFDSAKLKGPPALYLYFWSITAKNAASEMEKLADVYYEMSRKQLEVITVCADPDEKRADVLAFVKKNKIKFPIYFNAKETKELRANLAYPGNLTGYLFDKKGEMVGVTPTKYSDLKKYIK